MQMLIERDPAIWEIFKTHAADLRESIDRELLKKLLEK
jgi:hypothetical protein